MSYSTDIALMILQTPHAKHLLDMAVGRVNGEDIDHGVLAFVAQRSMFSVDDWRVAIVAVADDLMRLKERLR